MQDTCFASICALPVKRIEVPVRVSTAADAFFYGWAYPWIHRRIRHHHVDAAPLIHAAAHMAMAMPRFQTAMANASR
jgi:hypothetical protein